MVQEKINKIENSQRQLIKNKKRKLKKLKKPMTKKKMF